MVVDDDDDDDTSEDEASSSKIDQLTKFLITKLNFLSDEKSEIEVTAPVLCNLSL